MDMGDWNLLERELRRTCPQLELRRDESMRAHTAFRIGGPAALMALPKDQNQARAAVCVAAAAGVRPFFLGNGTNLLVADEGYEGLIVKLSGELRCLRVQGACLTAGAAAALSRLSCAAQEQGLTGLEFACGIPGFLGGAVVMNAGAYGGEMSQVLDSVTFLDEACRIRTLPASECGFAYRRSIFADHPEWLILEARLVLARGDRAEIRARMEELSRRRREKQPVDLPSAGSAFRRPKNGYAAALIDSSGCKGLSVGKAQVSSKHAGFIVNTGGATCADVLELMRRVRKRVLERTGVELEPEIKTLGVMQWNLS